MKLLRELPVLLLLTIGLRMTCQGGDAPSVRFRDSLKLHLIGLLFRFNNLAKFPGPLESRFIFND